MNAPEYYIYIHECIHVHPIYRIYIYIHECTRITIRNDPYIAATWIIVKRSFHVPKTNKEDTWKYLGCFLYYRQKE